MIHVHGNHVSRRVGPSLHIVPRACDGGHVLTFYYMLRVGLNVFYLYSLNTVYINTVYNNNTNTITICIQVGF